MRVGIIGLPNVGKSTLFKALTKKQVDISNYPFCTITPNIGLVAVPDKRLEKISQIIHPQKTTPAVIEFVDIAGLVKDAHQGKGLGNQFLFNIKGVDVICQIVRCFEDEKIAHLEGKINPPRDIEIINTELLMKDLEIIDKQLMKSLKEEKGGTQKHQENTLLLNELKRWIKQQKPIREIENIDKYQDIIKEFQLLTAKPTIYVKNINSRLLSTNRDFNHRYGNLSLDLKLEADLSELDQEEIKELKLTPGLDRLIKFCYDLLKLITFYTIVGSQETRAWSMPQGTKMIDCAAKIHSDFAQNFIKAEVIDWQELVKQGSWQKARQNGFIRIEGKDALVRDGDIIEIKT